MAVASKSSTSGQWCSKRVSWNSPVFAGPGQVGWGQVGGTKSLACASSCFLADFDQLFRILCTRMPGIKQLVIHTGCVDVSFR